MHVAGIPGPGCPFTGCGVANAVGNGTVPLSVFNQALARVLYQEERFGFIGCDNSSADCRNPGGIGSDRSGLSPIPEGTKAGPPQLGSKNGDAAISERVAEEGAVLLKNEKQALPITANDLKHGIAVSGPGAEFLVANPNNEGAAGFADRNTISPLQQLKALSGAPSAFTYTPANSPSGQAVPCNMLSSLSTRGAAPSTVSATTCNAKSGLELSSGPSAENLVSVRVDPNVDYSSITSRGQLSGGTVYQWSGWIYIPTTDSYVFRVQHSAAIPDAKASFSMDNSTKTLVDSESFYQGQYYGNMSVVVSPTNAGYIVKGLTESAMCRAAEERVEVTGTDCSLQRFAFCRLAPGNAHP